MGISTNITNQQRIWSIVCRGPLADWPWLGRGPPEVCPEIRVNRWIPWIGPLFWPITMVYHCLVVTGTWLDYDFPYIGNNHPIWLSYFSEGLKPPTRSPWFITMVYQWKLANKNSDPYAGWMLVEIKFPTINSCPTFYLPISPHFARQRIVLGMAQHCPKNGPWWMITTDLTRLSHHHQ